MRIFVYCCAAVLFSAISAPLIAEIHHTPGVSTETPFDPSQANLRPGFRGNDAETLLTKTLLLEKQEKKSEFETSVQWEARVAALRAKPLVGKVFMNSLLSSVYPYDAAKTSYDAEHGTLGIDLDILDDWFLSMRHKEHGSYNASNAFGGTVEVSRHDTISKSFRSGGSLTSFLKMQIAVPMSAKEARFIKPRIKALLVYYLDGGHPADSSEEYITPTFDIPWEGNDITQILHVQLVDVWIYDSATGKVLAKLSKPPEPKPIKEELKPWIPPAAVPQNTSDTNDGSLVQ